ncbi:MAG: hypothetical protein ACF8MF_02660 [Phycisphaerales bacterium JB052]
MKRMLFLVSVSCLSGSVYAQCGILPGSAPGDVITVGGLPNSYGVLDSGPGTMIFPTNWGNIFDHLIAGTYIGARTDVVISYTTNPIGIPRPAYYTQGGNSAVNINTDCDPHDYEIQLVQTVNQNESWSISETVSQTYSEQLSVSLGTDKSTTPITMGL